MQDTGRFYRRSMGAVSAVWTPSNGDPEQETLVYLDAPDSILNMGEIDVVVRSYQIRYPATAFQGLKAGEPLTVDGNDFRVVANPRAFGDGNDRVASLKEFQP